MPENNHVGQIPFQMKDNAGNPYTVWLDERWAEEWVPILTEMEEDTEQGNYAWMHTVDPRTEAQKRVYESNGYNYDFNPMDNLGDCRYEPQHIIFEKPGADEAEEIERQKIEAERAATRKEIEKLQPQQKDLLRRRETQTQAQIAAEDGVRQQAISNREMKIRRKVKKGLAEQGFTEDYYNRHRR